MNDITVVQGTSRRVPIMDQKTMITVLHLLSMSLCTNGILYVNLCSVQFGIVTNTSSNLTNLYSYYNWTISPL